ncbi:hypothetical protein [Leptospira noguchii]|uniref:Uncharacterized protein n=1 Tax=Leptospira noguchii TaxID=28182 RepID=A0A9Q8RJK2_9LEPT|nr:hypothetical protein [Leptospira noguchii]TQE73420.1 hypothetical protein FF021_12420 [Leptospira noguchii]UOG29497.1 hypothetical protein MAL06_12535 [Leptospira noguchii]UOG35172.1 hypothetical protein MAL02_05540 [Leptospira noguchii]UOG46081.1 hypothetical protein MAL01_05675 [Leptospira noguchii]UOG53716.1 hypothetical protein MAL09_06145 [Leptospira noguchii]
MILAFKNIQLRKLCENSSHALKSLGEPVSKKLKNRLSDFRAASSVQDLIFGGLIDKLGSGENVIIDLGDNSEMVCISNHNPQPLLSPSKIDWQRVFRIKIVKIGQKDE